MAGREILRSQYLSASWGSYYIIYTTYDIYGYATFLNQFGIDIQTGYFFSQKRRFDPLLFVYGHDQLKWTYQRWVSINWNGQFCRQNAGENASKGVFFPFAFLHVNDMQIVPIYRLDAFHNEQENPDQLPHDCTGVLTRQTTQCTSFSPLPLLPPPPIFICIYASLKKLKFRLYSFGMQFDLAWRQMHSESFIHVLN